MLQRNGKSIARILEGSQSARHLRCWLHSGTLGKLSALSVFWQSFRAKRHKALSSVCQNPYHWFLPKTLCKDPFSWTVFRNKYPLLSPRSCLRLAWCCNYRFSEAFAATLQPTYKLLHSAEYVYHRRHPRNLSLLSISNRLLRLPRHRAASIPSSPAHLSNPYLVEGTVWPSRCDASTG